MTVPRDGPARAVHDCVTQQVRLHRPFAMLVSALAAVAAMAANPTPAHPDAASACAAMNTSMKI